jgi:hypothetical protein
VSSTAYLAEILRWSSLSRLPAFLYQQDGYHVRTATVCTATTVLNLREVRGIKSWNISIGSLQELQERLQASELFPVSWRSLSLDHRSFKDHYLDIIVYIQNIHEVH